MRAGEKAWLAVLGIVVGTNTTCKDGDTMSEVADGWNETLTTLCAFAVAAHVSNRIPERLDIVHWAHVGIRAARRRLIGA